MSYDHLFSEAKLGDLTLPHRIIMAPLTRSRSAQPGDVPQDLNVTYYQQRSTAALIISEATQISPQGKGYAYTPGIHSNEQIQGWKKITDAVHQRGSKIFLQLWHVGRVSHSSLQPDGVLPVAPSAIAPEGQAFTEEGFKDFEIPRALETNEISGIVEQYKIAAINAKTAGFDGVEVHAANGYLLDQFLKDGTNKRTDEYGGSLENRVRLTIEVIKAVSEVWSGDRVGIRLSPTGTFNSMSDSDPQSLFNHLVEKLNAFNLAYIHVVERFGDVNDESFDFALLRQRFNGAYIANGGYTGESAEKSLGDNQSDFIAFGTPFISNPDLPLRLKKGAKLNDADPNTFYGGNEEGYTDYPSLEQELRPA
ncbi:alkene reductase [Aliikangiella coralliicola]|uniref:Alkene reductase n=1 Tax=Aliikangiella coralliicola TaxID=2592383 RepID=A0A545UA51_9GAMM|nr:alkene reductase [Aliikangiella coralliicola]TQV86358.1 alkene reductase [Aliikangiella coralliicola]